MCQTGLTFKLSLNYEYNTNTFSLPHTHAHTGFLEKMLSCKHTPPHPSGVHKGTKPKMTVAQEKKNSLVVTTG